MLLTRHRVSTGMYSLTFHVCITTPLHYGRNGMAHAAGALMLSPVRRAFAARMRSACGGPDGLPLGSATHFHSNATRAPIANPPNSAQLVRIPYHSVKLHPGPCNSVSMRPQTDRQMRLTTVHFSWSTIRAKCKKCQCVVVNVQQCSLLYGYDILA